MAYTKNPQFEINDMTDGIVLFDREREIAHHLNGPATLIWELLHHEDEQIAEYVKEIMGISIVEARELASDAIAQLREIHAIS